MANRYDRFSLLAATVCFALGLAPAEAANSQESKEPSGKDYLTAMAKTLASLRQFTVEVDSGYDVVQKDGRKIEYLENRKVSVLRPGNIRFDIVNNEGDEELFTLDGNSATGFSKSANAYATTQTTFTIDDAIGHLVDDLQVRMPLARMWSTALPAQIEQMVRSADVVETRTLYGVPCVHVSARLQRADLQVWLPTEGSPLPVRTVITYTTEPGAPQFWARFLDWNTSPGLTREVFRFVPPEGAERVPFSISAGRAAVAHSRTGERR